MHWNLLTTFWHGKSVIAQSVFNRSYSFIHRCNRQIPRFPEHINTLIEGERKEIWLAQIATTFSIVKCRLNKPTLRRRKTLITPPVSNQSSRYIHHCIRYILRFPESIGTLLWDERELSKAVYSHYRRLPKFTQESATCLVLLIILLATLPENGIKCPNCQVGHHDRKLWEFFHRVSLGINAGPTPLTEQNTDPKFTSACDARRDAHLGVRGATRRAPRGARRDARRTSGCEVRRKQTLNDVTKMATNFKIDATIQYRPTLFDLSIMHWNALTTFWHGKSIIARSVFNQSC
jgi:hypothetical protein